jgi:hypothetical protein
MKIWTPVLLQRSEEVSWQTGIVALEIDIVSAVLMSFGILHGLERLLDAFGDGRSCENGALQRFS